MYCCDLPKRFQSFYCKIQEVLHTNQKIPLFHPRFHLVCNWVFFGGNISCKIIFVCASAFQNFHGGIGMPLDPLAACAIGTQIILAGYYNYLATYFKT